MPLPKALPNEGVHDPSFASARPAAREMARALVLRHGWNATSYQILNPGMHLWFAGAGDAVAGYAEHAGFRVVAGAPVCAATRLAAVADELERDTAAAGRRVIYFGAGTRLEGMLAGRGSHWPLLLGAQPTWDARRWGEVVRRKASLRAQLNRARNKGVMVREWPPGEAERNPLLERVLTEWLATRGLPPLHFMTEAHTLGDLRDRRVFVAESARTGVIAFLVATPVPARRGWLVEQWPRLPGAPNGTTHLLVDAAMRALGASGATYVTLGLAPLSDRAGPVGSGQPLWLRAVLRGIRAHGRRFYNFRGLDAFKASLEPGDWEPIYAVSRSRGPTVRSLRAVAGVFGGGSPAGLVARAAWMGLAHELRRGVAVLRHTAG